VQCLWRRIPVDENNPREYQELYKKREATDLPIWSGMGVEMNELKLALGAED